VNALGGIIAVFVFGLSAGVLALVALSRRRQSLAAVLFVASLAALSLIAMFFITLVIVIDSA
jgi:hypothetical protein